MGCRRVGISSPFAPSHPPRFAFKSFDFNIEGTGDAPSLSESFGRFADFSDPGSPRVSHGLGNLRWDEARVRTEIGQDKAETRAKVPRGESGKSRRQRSEDERRNQASAITYGGRAGAGGAGRRRGETGAHTREGTERGYRQAAGGAVGPALPAGVCWCWAAPLLCCRCWGRSSWGG